MPLVTTARQDPVGRHLEDGHPTTLAFELAPDFCLWEKTVKPPGLDGGDKIPQTTMHNDQFRTFALRALVEQTDMTFTAAYDPRFYETGLSILNVEQCVSLHFSNGDVLNFFGGLRQFEPQDMSEGTQPEAQCTIAATNRDPLTGAETAPELIPNGGTGS